ncbi:MAG: hypothetical protein AAFR87_02925 [Bacteroidota bacterium]
MNKLTQISVSSLIGLIMLLGLSGFDTEPKALATVKRTAKGFMYTNINKSLIKKQVNSGLRVVDIFFHEIDGTFFLARKVVGKGKKGTLYSEVKREKNKLYPKYKPKLYFACWQVSGCQCKRPSQHASCKCVGSSSDACTSELGPKLWEAEYIYIE